MLRGGGDRLGAVQPSHVDQALALFPCGFPASVPDRPVERGSCRGDVAIAVKLEAEAAAGGDRRNVALTFGEHRRFLPLGPVEGPELTAQVFAPADGEVRRAAQDRRSGDRSRGHRPEAVVRGHRQADRVRDVPGAQQIRRAGRRSAAAQSAAAFPPVGVFERRQPDPCTGAGFERAAFAECARDRRVADRHRRTVGDRRRGRREGALAPCGVFVCHGGAQRRADVSCQHPIVGFAGAADFLHLPAALQRSQT